MVQSERQASESQPTHAPATPSRRGTRLGAAAAVIAAVPLLTPGHVQASPVANWAGTVNNVASNHGGAQIAFGETYYGHGFSQNARASEIAAITCDESWAFISEDYVSVPANNHGLVSLATSSGFVSDCWKVRVRTPGSSTNYHFVGWQLAF